MLQYNRNRSLNLPLNGNDVQIDIYRKGGGKSIYASVSDSIVSGSVVIVTVQRMGETEARSCLTVDDVA